MPVRPVVENLFVEPPVRRFATWLNDGESALVDLLSEQRETRPVPILEQRDVLLSDQGLLCGDLRLTSVAFLQICDALGSGLGPFLLNIAGQRPRMTMCPVEEYSSQVMIKLFNDVVRFRFGILRNCRLIVDTRAKTVEGLVGSRYRFFSNYELYQLMKQEAGDKLHFREAVLEGRSMLLRYVGVRRAFAVPVSQSVAEPFYGGWHLLNSELGQSRVRAAAVVFRSWSKTCSLVSASPRMQIVHARGPTFLRKLQAVFGSLRRYLAEIPKLESHVLAAQQRTLGFDEYVSSFSKHSAKLAGYLKQAGVPSVLSGKTVNLAVLHGSYHHDKQPVGLECGDVPLSPGGAASRTVYDLYNALCYLAENCSISQRETLEEVAYELLTGKVLPSTVGARSA